MLFLREAGERYATDPDLDALLGPLGGVPLAIELMAWRIEDTGNARRLLALWQSQRTAAARTGAGDDRRLSLAVSIELSLASPRLGGAGRRLFLMLGRLPDGLAREDIDELLGADAVDAAAGLRKVGLVRPSDDRASMLPPIREHAAGKELDADDEARLIAHFLVLGDALPQGDQPASEPERAERARRELSAIDAMLDRALTAGQCPAARRPGQAASPRHPVVEGRGCAPTARRPRPGDAQLRADAPRVAAARRRGARRSRPAARPLGLARADRRRAGGPGRPAGGADELPGLARDHRAAGRGGPGNAGWQRDLSVSHNKIGDVQVAQGDLPAALTSFQASLASVERLAEADPGNAGWQRDLSVSHDRIGDVQVAQGDLPAALTSYRASLDDLRPAGPGGPRQCRLAARPLGLAQQDRRRAGGPGRPAGGADELRASLAIRERLARADPGNAGWQRDLSVSHERIGDVQVEPRATCRRR